MFSILSIGATTGLIFACMMLVALFMLRYVAIKLAGTPAGEGLAAIVL